MLHIGAMSVAEDAIKLVVGRVSGGVFVRRNLILYRFRNGLEVTLLLIGKLSLVEFVMRKEIRVEIECAVGLR